MVQRSTVSAIAENRFLAAGIALIVIAVAVTVAIVNAGNDEVGSSLTKQGSQSESEAATEATPGGGQAGNPPATVGSGTVTAPALIPGLPGSPAAKPCSPRKVDATGVTDDTITIGQIVTDSNQIPQQLRPANEGLRAFIDVFNKSGGLCKRKMRLEYRNDNLNPATHNQDARELANSVFAFVGNESLLDFLDYQREPPFQPTVRGGGGYVPDVGGLAFGYGRSQSRWHAGVIGSVSPTLVGGGQYKFYMQEQKAKGTPCRKGGVVYLREPTGASEDQARLGQVSLEQSWGGGLGRGNTQLYATNLLDPVPAYEALVDRMVSDGMNCVFTYTDLQSSINLAQAMNNRGIWPPDKCRRGNQCFRVFSVVLSVYDRKFIQDAGDGARSVSTFIPHLPLVETSNPSMRGYLEALKAVRGARPSTFSILGFTSGLMLIQALQACPEAPTRKCVIDALHAMTNFTGGGLLGGTTPFKTTRATYGSYGTFNWKWIFDKSVIMRVSDRNGKRDFYRVGPSKGFLANVIHVARGSPG
jgi:ABC-type branched-subunit amino acid transport system substrate-binding protein